MRNPMGQPDSGTPSSVSPSSTNLKRRRFLFSAGTASVAAAAVTSVPAAAAVVAPQAESQPAQASGYRETEHVRKYYGTAKL